MSKSIVTEAEAPLSALLDRVARGERITIMRDGKAVASLGPVAPPENPDVRHVVEEMLSWRDREGPTLGADCSIRDLIEDGRRF